MTTCEHQEQIEFIERELRLWPLDYTDDQDEKLRDQLDELRDRCGRECV